MSGAAELQSLQAARRSLAISQRKVNSAILEARKRRPKAKATTRTVKRRRHSRKSK